MTKRLNGIGAAALIAMLAACGQNEGAANETAADNAVNMTIAADNLASAPEPTANEVIDEAAPAVETANEAEERPRTPPKSTAAPKKAAPSGPVPPKPTTPTKPKTSEPVVDPHAGHDMNNMTH